MAHHSRHGGRRRPPGRRHPHPRRDGHHRHRGPAHRRLLLRHHGRQPGHRRGHHPGHPVRALPHAEGGNLHHRQGVRPHHDAVVCLPGRLGPRARHRQRRRPARAQPRARPHVPLRRQPQRRRRHGPGQRLPLHHRRRGPLLRHGSRGQGQHLRLLALREGLPHHQLPGPGRLDHRQQRQREPHGRARPQPLLPDAARAAARLRGHPVRLRGHHRLPGAHHGLLLHRFRGRPPRPHAAHARQLPLRDQGPDLHPHGQQHHVGGLHGRRPAVPQLRAHGGGVRPGHHGHHAHDHAAAVHLPLQGAPQDGPGHPVPRLLRRHRGHVLLLEPHQVLPRRLRDRAACHRHLRRHVRLAPRHRHRAHPDRVPARRQVPGPALRPLPRRGLPAAC